MQKTVSAQEALNFLNGLLASDRRLVECLYRVRVQCNENTCNDPYIQVRSSGGSGAVNFIGLFNGLFKCDGRTSYIHIKVDDAGGIASFELYDEKLDESKTSGKED